MSKLEMPIEDFAIAVSKENARLNAEIERLQAALDRADAWRKEHLYDEPCGCAYDTPDDWCLGHLPKLRELEAAKAEIERLREALTPSGATKAAYGGEFTFPICIGDDDGEDIHDIVTVPWTTIKEIMAAIRARAALEAKE